MAAQDVQEPLLLPLEDSTKSTTPKWKKELGMIFALALPCIVCTCSAQTMVITDQVFVGHLGVTQLAAAALGNTYFNLMWFFLLGCSTALDTLGSQAYGARDYSALLTWTCTAALVLSILCGIMAVGLWYAKEVALYLFFQPLEVADQVSVFCRYLIPGLWPMMWSVVCMKFMQTQNCMVPPAIIAASTCVLNVINNGVFIHYMGFVGAPIATSLSRFIQFFLYIIVLAHLQGKSHPGGWRKLASKVSKCWRKACTWRVLWLFIELGIPGGFMLALEAGSFEITTTFAGALGTVEVAAHSALLGICSYTFISFPFAVATAATIRVGNLLGANQAEQASLAAKLCVAAGTVFQGSCGLVMLVMKDKLAYLFTSDLDVVRTTASIAIFGVAFQFFDGAFGTAQGVLRGLGRQNQLMIYNLIGFWGFGVAFGWYLTFKAKLGLKGLWIGIDSGDFAAMALCVLTWLLVNWRKEAALAQQRMALSHDEQQKFEAVGHLEGEDDDELDFLVPPKPHGSAADPEADPFGNGHMLYGSAPASVFSSPRYRGA